MLSARDPASVQFVSPGSAACVAPATREQHRTKCCQSLLLLLLLLLLLSLLLLLLFKKNGNAIAGRGRLTPYQSEDPSPTLPNYRGKEKKGKIVEDKKGASN